MKLNNAKSIISNPYNILHLSCLASEAEINNKKKLAKLHPERAEEINRAITEIRDKKYRWLWFSEGNIKNIADLKNRPLNEYDKFLYDYYCALVDDVPDEEKWTHILAVIDYLCSSEGSAILESHFGSEDFKRMGETATDHFLNAILEPLYTLIKSDYRCAYSIYVWLKNIVGSIVADSVSTEAFDAVVSYFAKKTNQIQNAVRENVDVAIDKFDSLICDDYCAISFAWEKGENIRKDIRKHLNIAWKYVFSQAIKEQVQMEKLIRSWYFQLTQSVRSECKTLLNWNETDELFAYKYIADHGEPVAIHKYAYFLREGIGCTASLQEAFEYYKMAASAGRAKDMTAIATMYVRGDGCKHSAEMAFSWYKQAAIAGEPVAMSHFGDYYYAGKFVDKNFSKAFYWYKRSYECGNDRAAYKCGLCCYYGNGCVKNYNLAFNYFLKSADCGNKDAMEMLSVCYFNGLGCLKSDEQALLWHQNAIKAGSHKTL